MNQETLDSVLKILKSRQQELRSYFSSSGTDCYRIFNRSFANLPLFIDRYGSYIHLTQLEGPEELDLSEEELKKIAGTLYCPMDRLIVKRRKSLAEHEQYTPLKDEQEKLIVHENDLSFQVNLRDYIDTGLFLDHRPTRQMVREECFDLSVLNLFSYTGSFSVYAASGGAKRITTVDLSAPYLEQAKENFRLNDFLPGAFEFVQADVFKFLKESAEKKEKWDLIILDPPTFSNSRKMERTLKIQDDYKELIEACCKVMKGGGRLLFSNNQSDFRFHKKDFPTGLQIDEITKETTAEDFKNKPAHKCWVITGFFQGKTGHEGSSRKAPRSSGNRRPERGRHSRS
ncbi:methyltransferase domain-containing protein [Oceanispirochaeta crateris]|uniref:Methyltransferase domain-containing protein n=1 Tax=Oceanispirochaeta crateris TaxID=2518645 RepID=A0A5C1QNV0_9SPIO|nr:class I SAM-dependent methyltransferase [Oceanispirochaeta crateris]QEN09018.1 methyltransferase domain-containing protein [Oceanispirochaeta crateris]